MQQITQLKLIAQSDNKAVAEVATVIVAVWDQYSQGAVDREDWASILERNRRTLEGLEASAVRDLAVESLKDLL